MGRNAQDEHGSATQDHLAQLSDVSADDRAKLVGEARQNLSRGPSRFDYALPRFLLVFGAA